MYSRYQPFDPMENLLHGPAREEPTHHPPPAAPLRPAPSPSHHTPKGKGVLGGLLQGLKLDLDTGDILLLLIILFLSQESDDMEIVILLALVLLMGL